MVVVELKSATNENVGIEEAYKQIGDYKKNVQSLRNQIRRLLKKYDYPPKQARHALEIVMRQTKLMSENIAYEKAMEDRLPRSTTKSMVAEESEDYLICY